MDIFYAFKKATNFDIEGFINKATDFFKTDYYQIENFYSGKIDVINPQPFIRLKELDAELKQIYTLWSINKTKFKNTIWLELIEVIEDFDSRIMTTFRLNRWLRSTLNSFNWDNSVSVERILSQNETLEKIAKDYFSNDPDAWSDIAKSNNLSELDYSIEGGSKLLIKGKEVSIVGTLTSVVDTVDGKSIYGLDFDKFIQIVDEDLKTLDYDETALQAVDILVNLKKNDNGDNPDDGIQKSIVIGTNRNLLNFPIITRQMTATFTGDDSLQNFQVLSVKLVEDILYVDISVETRDSTKIKKSISF